MCFRMRQSLRTCVGSCLSCADLLSFVHFCWMQVRHRCTGGLYRIDLLWRACVRSNSDLGENAGKAGTFILQTGELNRQLVCRYVIASR